MTGRLERRRRHRLLVPSVITLALISAACTGSGTDSAPRSSPTADQGTPASVAELTSINMLRDAFNDDAGSTRLILLISPT